MKIVMINDCAFVGETLLKYLPLDFERSHIKRTRGGWSKTFGIFFDVLRAKGEVYHVNYLLQDCFIAQKLGKKPLLGHAHGSDLREVINGRFGRIVRSNLTNCTKILVSQPTILDVAREHNATSEYLPIPYDPSIFYPKPTRGDDTEKRVFIASAHDFAIKGTDKFVKALVGLREPVKVRALRIGRDAARFEKLAREFGLNLELIDRVRHDEMNLQYWESDLVLGSYSIGQLDTVAIEAMACGRPVIHSVSKKHFADCPLEELGSVDEAAEVISELISDRRKAEARVSDQLRYVESRHPAPLLAKRLQEIYEKLAEER